jgi:NAD(P)-dependent dehydrogenase (short-subunit alcohol dehydrogenase family)
MELAPFGIDVTELVPGGVDTPMIELGPEVDERRLHARLDLPFDVEELTAGLSNETFLAAHP